jgi:hypothetical protein
MAKPLSELIKAVNKAPVRRTLTFQGEEYEFYMTYLTLGERERVRQTQKNQEDSNEFALRLLIAKAQNKDGSRMFQVAKYAELKEEWPASELEAAMMQMIAPTEEEEAAPEAETNPKPSRKPSEKTDF